VQQNGLEDGQQQKMELEDLSAPPSENTQPWETHIGETLPFESAREEASLGTES
jgi:hypothetical protein